MQTLHFWHRYELNSDQQDDTIQQNTRESTQFQDAAKLWTYFTSKAIDAYFWKRTNLVWASATWEGLVDKQRNVSETFRNGFQHLKHALLLKLNRLTPFHSEFITVFNLFIYFFKKKKTLCTRQMQWLGCLHIAGLGLGVLVAAESEVKMSQSKSLPPHSVAEWKTSKNLFAWKPRKLV